MASGPDFNQPLAVLNFVRAERGTVASVNPRATFQKAYAASKKGSPPRRVASPTKTLPVQAVVHGFALPSAVVVQASLSPKKIEAAVARAAKPIPRRASAAPPSSAVPVLEKARRASTGSAQEKIYDVNRLKASQDARRATGKEGALGYTLIELKTIAAALGLGTSGKKAEVLARIMTAVQK